MRILRPALVLVAILRYGVEAIADITSVTTKVPLETRAVDMSTTKKHCNRLAVCAGDPAPIVEVRSIDTQKNENKPKQPIIFDRCMLICRKEWPMHDSRQQCCDYCDEMLSCCPGAGAPAAGGIPALCQSARHRLPGGTRVRPEPSLREAVDREREWLRGAMGNATGRTPPPPHVASSWERLVREGPEARARVWDDLYSRAAVDELRRLEGRPPLSDGEWAAVEGTLPDRERFVNGPLLGDDEGDVGAASGRRES